MSIALTVLLAAVVILALALSVRQRHSALSDSYQSRKVLSEPEQTLYWRLREAMPNSIFASANVPLIRLSVRKIPPADELRALFTR